MSGKPASSKAVTPIGIVAGGGVIVGELIDVLTTHSKPCVVAAIKGEADASLTSSNIAMFEWGEIGKILSFFKKNDCKNLILIGKITKRPDFRSILGDPGTLIRIPKIVSAMTGGDDTLLRKVIGLIEEEGFQVIGIGDIAPELLLQAGSLGKKHPNKTQRVDIEKGKEVLRDLGQHDIGQSLVIYNGRILAVEGAEGTDQMLQRIASLRQEGRITQKPNTGILLKASKPEQDKRVDLPTIGPNTAKLAAQAGLAGIVAEADCVLLAAHKETGRLIDHHKLFLCGESGFNNV